MQMLRSADGHNIHFGLLERLGQVIVHGDVLELELHGAVPRFVDGLAANPHDLRIGVAQQRRNVLRRNPTCPVDKYT